MHYAILAYGVYKSERIVYKKVYYTFFLLIVFYILYAVFEKKCKKVA